MQLAHPQTSYFMANSRARRRRDAVSLALEQLLRLFSEGAGDTALHSGRGPERGVQPRPPVSRACISLATPANGHGGVFRGARKAPREGARARAVPTPFTLLRDSLTPPRLRAASGPFSRSRLVPRAAARGPGPSLCGRTRAPWLGRLSSLASRASVFEVCVGLASLSSQPFALSDILDK